MRGSKRSFRGDLRVSAGASRKILPLRSRSHRERRPCGARPARRDVAAASTVVVGAARRRRWQIARCRAPREPFCRRRGRGRRQRPRRHHGEKLTTRARSLITLQPRRRPSRAGSGRTAPSWPSRSTASRRPSATAGEPHDPKLAPVLSCRSSRAPCRKGAKIWPVKPYVSVLRGRPTSVFSISGASLANRHGETS